MPNTLRDNNKGLTSTIRNKAFRFKKCVFAMATSSDDELLTRLQEKIIQEHRNRNEKATPAGKFSRMENKRKRNMFQESNSDTSGHEDLVPMQKEDEEKKRPLKRRLLERSSLSPQQVIELDKHNNLMANCLPSLVEPICDSKSLADRIVGVIDLIEDKGDIPEKDMEEEDAEEEDVKEEDMEEEGVETMLEFLNRPVKISLFEKEGRDELSADFSTFRREIISIYKAFSTGEKEFECIPTDDQRHIEGLEMVIAKLGLRTEQRDCFMGICVVAHFKENRKPILPKSEALKELRKSLQKKLQGQKRPVDREWDEEGYMIMKEDKWATETTSSTQALLVE